MTKKQKTILIVLAVIVTIEMFFASVILIQKVRRPKDQTLEEENIYEKLTPINSALTTNYMPNQKRALL